ncbi:MAG TPA: hypothetical protein VF743_06445, partial [Acidimicrobiales bacterium]
PGGVGVTAIARPASSALARLLPSGEKPRATAVFWVGAACAYLVLLAGAMATVSYDIWAALVIVPIITVLTVPVLRRAARLDPDPSIGTVLIWGYVCKIIGTFIRYAVTFEVYTGRADATGYHGAGVRLSHAFFEGSRAFSQQAEIDLPKLTGTPFVRIVTMVIYIISGPTQLGGFIIFSWLSFWGMFWFYRACVIAFPEANHRRYAILLFFLPTMLYWPSSIGKEAWMIFSMGLATYGVACILKHKPLGYLACTLGLAATAMVRPHITVLIFASLFVAYLLRRRSWRQSKMGPVGKFLGVAVLLVAGGVVVSQAASFFNLDDVDAGGVDQVLARTERQSGQGGSEFEGARPTKPSQFPQAMLAVLFRPYLWEANNAQALIAALEGTVLLILFGASISRFVRLPAYLFRVPYVAYCLAYVVMFVFAFSSIGNFGIMTRQRTQVFPFVLVLLAIPATEVFDRLSGKPTLETRMEELAARQR